MKHFVLVVACNLQSSLLLLSGVVIHLELLLALGLLEAPLAQRGGRGAIFLRAIAPGGVSFFLFTVDLGAIFLTLGRFLQILGQNVLPKFEL